MIYYLICGAVAVIIAFIYQSYSYKKNKALKALRIIEEKYGNRPTREYEYEEFENATHYYTNTKHDKFVDDITWNDLDMDSIYILINSTYSSIGDEYLYNLLRTPTDDLYKLKKRDELINYFENHKDVYDEYAKEFISLGHTKKISFFEYFKRLIELGKRNNTPHTTALFLIAASIMVTIAYPGIGIICIIVALLFNISTYYKYKAEVENYFICVKFIVNMMTTAENIIKLDIKELNEYNDTLKENLKELSSLKHGLFLITSNGMSGNIQDLFMDYIRMVTHIDLLKFNSMLSFTISHIDVIENVYNTLGELESAMAVSSYRKMLPFYAKPEFATEKNILNAIDTYHPLIEEPVANSINDNKCILLTGSNASGKSTFLKTIAINAILAQTIYTVSANSYKTSFYNVYSSMALRDDLGNNESYFIVEIKSLKRIIDKLSEGENVLCFVDEVLRGTNTIERIAASSNILKVLSQNGAKCFAATHDIELTKILDKYYNNYHFQEQVKDNQVLFDYKLNKGQATSRNAIKLLSVLGYDKDLVNASENTANKFINEGVWEKI